MGYARVCVRVDLRLPLRPGTLMMAGGVQLWQRFVYENLDNLCLHCGVLHPAGSQCPVAPVSEGATGGADESGARAAGPRLGPWVLAVRRRLPAAGGVDGSSGNRGAPATVQGSTPGEGWLKPPRVARRPPPARSLPEHSVVDRGTERGKKEVGGAGNPFSALADEGEGSREGGSPSPNKVSKRARPNESKGSLAPVQPASRSNLGLGRGHGRSRMVASNLSKGKQVALGQDQSISESGRCVDETGVFMFTASDRGGSGFIEDCLTPSPGGGQLSAAQAVDPLLVSVQASPRSAERGMVQGGGQSVGLGDQEAPRGSPGLAHEVAVSRLRQAIQGDGEGNSDGRVAVVDGADEDIMCGVEDATQIPHSISS